MKASGYPLLTPDLSMNIRLFPELVHQMGLLIPAYAASGVASDVYISAVMCLLLRASRTEHKRRVAP
jgi:hypothetical protein